MRAALALAVLEGVDAEGLEALCMLDATSMRSATMGSGALGAKNVGTGISCTELGALGTLGALGAGVIGAKDVGKIAGGCASMGCGV